MPRSTIFVVATVGIDMGKNTLLDSRGAIVLREKMARGRISSRLANLPPCLIGIEAQNNCRVGFPTEVCESERGDGERSRQRVRDLWPFGAETRMRSSARGYP
jgi:hypothetical protein